MSDRFIIPIECSDPGPSLKARRGRLTYRVLVDFRESLVGKCVKICENLKIAQMSTDLYLHEFVRALIAGNKVDTFGWSNGAECFTGKLVHRVIPSTASTAASSMASANDNLIVADDIERLRAGDEIRTTIMIKRVPRKYTLEFLRREVDSVMPRGGSYDLLYLPVDSAKMTNRGYAFINFTSPEKVERFVREFINRPWKELNRKNKAAVLYWAFVQGKDATLAHINTEVMSRRGDEERVY